MAPLRYSIDKADVIAWCAEYAAQIEAGMADPFHAVGPCDPPYCIEFMGDGKRDAPHLAYLAAKPDEVQAAADVTGLDLHAAAAFCWYKAVYKGLMSVVYPGAWLMAFSGTRTAGVQTMAMRAAGWYVEDTIAYMYGNGSALFSARADEAGDYRMRLKPSREELIIARAPIPKDYSLKRAHEEWGTTGLNVGDPLVRARLGGRFPPNIVLQHLPSCRSFGDRRIKNRSGAVRGDEPSSRTLHCYGQADGAWTCAPGCPVAALNGQAGAEVARYFYTSKAAAWERDAGLDTFGEHIQHRTRIRANPGGLAKDPRWADKISKNPHPTLKSIEALEYPARLIKRPFAGARYLVPFSGSGSEMCALVMSDPAGFVQGIELDQDEQHPGVFVPVALARLQWWSQFDSYAAARAAHKAALAAQGTEGEDDAPAPAVAAPVAAPVADQAAQLNMWGIDEALTG